MNVQKIITIVIGAIIALGGLAITISFLSNQSVEKNSTEIVFMNSTGGDPRTVDAGSSLAEKGTLRLGEFAVVQLSNDDSAAELISADFDAKTESLDSARIRVNSGSVLAINLLFGTEITVLDDRIAVVDRGGSLVFEKEVDEKTGTNSTRVRVLSGDAEISFVDPASSASFAGILIAGEEIEFDDTDIAAIFAAGDEIAQVAKWQSKIGKFSSKFEGESKLIGQILGKLPNGEMSGFVNFTKEYLIFNPEKKEQFYAAQLAGALAAAAKGDSSGIDELLATSNASKRAQLQIVAARAQPFTRLFIPESLTPALKAKIIRLAELENPLANFAGVAALSPTADLNRSLFFIFDDPTNSNLTQKFLTRAKNGIDAANDASAKYLLAILEIDPKNTNSDWTDGWAVVNRARIVDDLDLAKAITRQLELTDALVQVGREKLAGSALKVLASLLDRASTIFDESSLEMIAAAGNEFRNQILFLASLQGESKFEEDAYQIWLTSQEIAAEIPLEDEDEPVKPETPGRVARPEAELTKFLDADIPESDTQSAEEKMAAADNLAAQCAELPEKLENCAEYVCEFTHPFTGENLVRRISGIVEEKCVYSEKMPGGGELNCNYSEEMLVAIAQYYRDTVFAETETTVENSGKTTTKIYLINGEEVENPLDAATESGECVISGY